MSMSLNCVQCRGVPTQEVRIGAEWLPVCSKVCGHAFHAARIGPEQEAVTEDGALAALPDEMIMEILKQYPPSQLLSVAGTNARLRAIVLDAHTIRILVDHSFDNGDRTHFLKWRNIAGEWLALARRAAANKQTPLAEAIVLALDDRPMDYLQSHNPQSDKGLPWEWSRLMLALPSGDVEFARRMAAGLSDLRLAMMAPFVVRLGDVLAMQTYLACLERPAYAVNFRFHNGLSRAELFANKSVFAVLLASPRWEITTEPSNPPSLAKDAVLVDAIRLDELEIVKMLLASGRVPLDASLLEIPAKPAVTAVLLANPSVNPSGYRSIEERNKAAFNRWRK